MLLARSGSQRGRASGGALFAMARSNHHRVWFRERQRVAIIAERRRENVPGRLASCRGAVSVRLPSKELERRQGTRAGL
jgi:hypothetical protein